MRIIWRVLLLVALLSTGGAAQQLALTPSSLTFTFFGSFDCDFVQCERDVTSTLPITGLSVINVSGSISATLKPGTNNVFTVKVLSATAGGKRISVVRVRSGQQVVDLPVTIEYVFNYQLGISVAGPGLGSNTITVTRSGGNPGDLQSPTTTSLFFQSVTEGVSDWLRLAVPSVNFSGVPPNAESVTTAATLNTGVIPPGTTVRGYVYARDTLFGDAFTEVSYAAPLTTTLTASPSSLSFTHAVGSPAPAGRPVQIASASPAAGVLVSASLPAGSQYFSVSAPSCTTPCSITVTPRTAGLSAGSSYTGTLRLTAGSAAAEVPLTLSVSQALAQLSASLSALTFSFVAGAAGSATQQVSVSSGSSPVPFAAASNQPWLTITPDSGNTPRTLAVAVNPALLGPGSLHTATITISSPQASNSSVSVAVAVTVIQSGFAFSDSLLSFTSRHGLIADTKTISVTSMTPTEISFDAVSDAAWLKGAVSGVTPATLTISTDAAGLAPGQYVGHITLADRARVAQDSRITVLLTVSGGALRFVPVTPCRVFDTRLPNGSFGGPALGADQSRDFVIPQGACGIPSTAQAYSINVSVVPQGSLPYLTVWPAGAPRPLVATLNSVDGRIKGNAAIVPAGNNGAISVYAYSPTDVILDINGYFVESGMSQAGLAYYPLGPCRIADTRLTGGPLAANSVRSFAPLASGCNVPPSAQAYALNVTVVPEGPLGYLTVWPSGAPQPLVATLNAVTGTIVANQAIVPAGTGGSIELFATHRTDVVIDINGYFAPPGTTGAMYFYPVVPCRAMDTRNANGSLGGPRLVGERAIPVSAGACGIPGSAAAVSANATVVPEGPLGYLTLWRTGQPQPLASTLNALDGQVTNNAVIVPANAGSISSFVTSATDLVLDVNGYFAP